MTALELDETRGEPGSATTSTRSGQDYPLERPIFFLFLGVAFLAHLWANLRYTVNMPFSDDYDAVLGFLNRLSATHGFREELELFFSLHNEHRLVFGRLVETAFFHLFGGVNFSYLIAVGQIGLYLIVLLFLVHSRRSLGKETHLMAPAAILLLAFSQNALMAKFAMASLQQYYQLFFALLALYLATRPARARLLPLVLLCATLSSFSGGGGLVTFAVLLLYFLFEREWRLSLIEGVYGLLVYAFYFYFLLFKVTEIGRASRALALAHPFMYLRFVLAFLGSVGGDHYLLSGVLLLACGAVLLFVAVRRSKGRWSFPTLAAVLVMATAVGAGWGRLGMGVHEAASSRYAIYSLVFAATLYLTLLSLLRSSRSRRALGLAGLLVSVLTLGAWFSPAIKTLGMRADLLESALVYPDQARAMRTLETSMKLGIFQPIASIDRRLPSSLPLAGDCLYEQGYLGSISKLVYRDGVLKVEGWAAVPPDRQPASAVIIEVDGRFYPVVYGYRHLYGLRRPLRYNARLRPTPSAASELEVSVIVVGPGRDHFYRSPSWIVDEEKGARLAKTSGSSSDS